MVYNYVITIDIDQASEMDDSEMIIPKDYEYHYDFVLVSQFPRIEPRLHTPLPIPFHSSPTLSPYMGTVQLVDRANNDMASNIRNPSHHRVCPSHHASSIIRAFRLEQ